MIYYVNITHHVFKTGSRRLKLINRSQLDKITRQALVGRQGWNEHLISFSFRKGTCLGFPAVGPNLVFFVYCSHVWVFNNVVLLFCKQAAGFCHFVGWSLLTNQSIDIYIYLPRGINLLLISTPKRFLLYIVLYIL